MTWVSLRKFSGNSGRMGRSIWREGQDFLLAGAAFTLDEAAGGCAHPRKCTRGNRRSEGRSQCPLSAPAQATDSRKNDGVALGHKCRAPRPAWPCGRFQTLAACRPASSTVTSCFMRSSFQSVCGRSCRRDGTLEQSCISVEIPAGRLEPQEKSAGARRGDEGPKPAIPMAGFTMQNAGAVRLVAFTVWTMCALPLAAQLGSIAYLRMPSLPSNFAIARPYIGAF